MRTTDKIGTGMSSVQSTSTTIGRRKVKASDSSLETWAHPTPETVLALLTILKCDVPVFCNESIKQ